MREPQGFSLHLAEANDWVKNLLLLQSLGVVDGDNARLSAGKSARLTAAALSKAAEVNLHSLKVDDVGRVGARQLAQSLRQAYFRPGDSLEKPHYSATMFPLTLRFLSQKGRVSYKDFNTSATPADYSIQQQETHWIFNETRQNIVQQLERLEHQLVALMAHSGFVAQKPYETLRLGHFLSATLQLMGRR